MIDEILNQVISGKNTKTIREHEEKLYKFADENYNELLTRLANIISDESENLHKRKLAGSVLKNMIARFEHYKGNWLKADKEFRYLIKNCILSTLASKEKEIVYSSSDTIAAICSVENPLGEWPEIYTTLINTSNDPNPEFRMSSILTLGFICEELNPKYLYDELKWNIIKAVLNNFNPYNFELLKIAGESFIRIIPCIGNFFELQENKEFILNKIYDVILIQDLLPLNINILGEISRKYYSILTTEVSKFIEISKQTFFSKNDEVITHTFELWIGIAMEEIRRKQKNLPYANFSNMALPLLMEAMKYHYLNRDRMKEKEDKDKWTNAKSASVLISYLCQYVDQTIIDFVFDLIKNHLMSEDSKIKESVILAFGSISETQYQSRIKEILEGALPSLLILLEDKSIDVRGATAWSLRKICEFHIDALIHISQTNPDLLKLFIGTLLKNLNSNRRVVMNIIDSFNKIAVKSKELSELTSIDRIFNSSILSIYYPDIINELLVIPFKKGAYDTENNVAMIAFYAVNSLVENCPLDCLDILNSFFPMIVSSLETTDKSENCHTKEQKYAYQEAICSIISLYMMEERITLNNEQIIYLFNLVIGYFHGRGVLFESGLLLCSRLIKNAYKNNWDHYEEMFSTFSKFLFFALESWEDSMICLTAINCISEFIENLYHLLINCKDEIISKIISIGSNPNADKKLKLRVLGIFTDFFVMNISLDHKTELKIMELLDNACAATLHMCENNEDEELNEYKEELIIAILEAFSGLVSCFKEKNRYNFDKISLGIMNYMKQVLQISFNNPEILALCLGLYVDFYEMNYKSDEFEKDMIEKIYIKLNMDHQDKYRELLTWVKVIVKS